MDSETVMPSKISQKKDVKGHTISLAYIGYKTESHRQTRQTNENSWTQTTVQWLAEGKGARRSREGYRAQHMVAEGDLTRVVNTQQMT